MFQTSISYNIGFGVVGNVRLVGPTRMQPARLLSPSALNNRIGRAFTITDDATASYDTTEDPQPLDVRAGGTGVFAGILVNPLDYVVTLDGLDASTTLPNNTMVELAQQSAGIIVEVNRGAAIGDWVWFDQITGALTTTAPGAAAPAGASRVPGGRVTRFKSAAAGLVVMELDDNAGAASAVDPNAWMDAFKPGSNIYTQSQWQAHADAGLAPQVLSIFNENAAGTESWAQNVVKSAQNVTNYTWAQERGLQFDTITLTANPAQPMSEFIARQHDPEYVQIIQNSVALAGPNAAAIFLPHNHELDLPLQPDGHYAHTANRAGGNADFKAGWDVITALSKPIDPRIKLGIVRIGNVTPYTPSWNWRDAMPDRAKVDWFGADPYYFPRFDGTDGAYAAFVKIYAGDFSLEPWRQYYYGLPFALREFGAASTDVRYCEVIFDWLAAYPSIMYVNWWDQNNNAAVGGVKPTKVGYDTSFASWPEMQAWWVREFNPPVLLTPSTVNVEAGVTYRIRLRCTKNRVTWSIRDNPRPDAITLDGTDLVVTMPAGSTSVTVRATDRYKNVTDLTISVNVATTGLYPPMAAGTTFMRGPDNQPARGPDNGFISCLAA